MENESLKLIAATKIREVAVTYRQGDFRRYKDAARQDGVEPSEEEVGRWLRENPISGYVEIAAKELREIADIANLK